MTKIILNVTILVIIAIMTVVILSLSLSISVSMIHQSANAQLINKSSDIETELKNPSNSIPSRAILLVYSDSQWRGSVLDSSYSSTTQQGSGNQRIEFACRESGTFSVAIQKQAIGGYLILAVIQNGTKLGSDSTSADYGLVTLTGLCIG